MQTGIIGAFLHAGIANKAIFMFLLLLSIYSWGVIISKLRLLSQFRKVAEEYRKSVEQDIKPNFLLFPKSDYTKIMYYVVNKSKEDRETAEYQAKSMLYNSQLARGTFTLATISNIAPFIGLLGTVIGVINSFQQIGLSGSVSLAVIAPGIAEALYATALGLFVAIPASVFYNTVNSNLEKYENDISLIVNYTNKSSEK